MLLPFGRMMWLPTESFGDAVALPRIEGLLQRLIRQAAESRYLLVACSGLAFAGTVSAAYPVTAVIVPAALLAPHRWRAVSVVSAIASAVGATVLVVFFHHLGWAPMHAHFPSLASDPGWARVIDWVARYGPFALFAIAASPLPQTPALIFFALARHDYFDVFIAMAAGKLFKYGLFAWAAARFPERFRNGVWALFGRRQSP